MVWCPKYRKKILIGKLACALSSVLDEISKERGWSMITKEIQPDHVHIFLSIPPAISVSNVIKILKGSTARKLFVQFPELKKTLWGGHLWAPSYYVGTAGNVSAEVIQSYIERAEHIRGRK